MAQARTNPWLVLLVLTTGFFMILLDTTIVNVAIPAMSTGLNTTLDQILWVLNAYILVYAVLLITAGRLGDLYGQRNLFAIGLFVFTVASALCGVSQSPGQLIAARILQGVGGALLTPQTLSILTTIFPPERRGAAFGVWGGVAGLATLAGPTVGGAIITYIDWRWIFFINVPIGIAALIATYIVIPDLRPGRHHGWDFVGTIVATAGLFAIVFGLIEGQRYNWGQVESYPFTIPEVIGAGVVLVILFIIWERYQAEPLVPLSLFADRNFTVANWIAAAISFGMLSAFLPITIYLQSVRGFSALVAGLTLAPMSLTSMLTAPFAGRLSDRIGGKYILMAGISLFTIGIGLIAYIAGPEGGRGRFRRPQHDSPARRGYRQRGDRRDFAEPARDDLAQPGRRALDIIAGRIPRRLHRGVHQRVVEGIRDRRGRDRGEASQQHSARGGAADRGHRPRRVRVRLHRCNESDLCRAGRVPGVHRDDHAADQAAGSHVGRGAARGGAQSRRRLAAVRGARRRGASGRRAAPPRRRTRR
ncbi:MAG: DHA2 family efflux MFS transporter permease subunit [Chloroflexi bacterium]|nr:MAG: DHA2 family efflux MFS transporter permease subunit [Chloroflexota bacterium]